MVERAVYRWAGQEGPIEDIQFDPFDSPWRPAAGQGVLGPVGKAAPVDLGTVSPETVPLPAEQQPASTAATAYRPDDCADLRVAVAEYEKAILAAALEKCRWNQRAAAAALSLTYDQLRHAMRRHELQG